MPVYEYTCEECGERFELFLRSPSQQANAVCPQCGTHSVKKAVSLFGVGAASSSSASGPSCSSGPT